MIALNNFQTGATSIRWRKRFMETGHINHWPSVLLLLCTTTRALLVLVITTVTSTTVLVLLLVLANILLEHTHKHTLSLSHSPTVSLLRFLLSNLAFYAQSTSTVISLLISVIRVIFVENWYVWPVADFFPSIC